MATLFVAKLNLKCLFTAGNCLLQLPANIYGPETAEPSSLVIYQPGTDNDNDNNGRRCVIALCVGEMS